MSSIARVGTVFTCGKAIKSTDQRESTIWFYRHSHGEDVAVRREDGSRQYVDVATVERNVESDLTDVETVPVEESPFDETEGDR